MFPWTLPGLRSVGVVMRVAITHAGREAAPGLQVCCHCPMPTGSWQPSWGISEASVFTITSCRTGKNLLNALVFLPMILQGMERKKLVSQEFLLKNADQRFCANYFLQLFNTSCNYWVLKNILGNNFWALLLFASIYCHKRSQPLEMLKDDCHKYEGDRNGCLTKTQILLEVQMYVLIRRH